MKRFQETRYTRPSAAHAWFKNMIEMHTYIKQLDTFKYDSQVVVNYQYASIHGTKDFCIRMTTALNTSYSPQLILVLT